MLMACAVRLRDNKRMACHQLPKQTQAGHRKAKPICGARSDPRQVTRKRRARALYKCRLSPVGSAASVDKAFAMLKLTITLNISYKQVRALIVLLMLLFR